jgi:hypothetical protein
MVLPQPIEYKQYSYGVFERKHYMECTTLIEGFGLTGAVRLLVLGQHHRIECLTRWRFGALLRRHASWVSGRESGTNHQPLRQSATDRRTLERQQRLTKACSGRGDSGVLQLSGQVKGQWWCRPRR